MCVCVCLYVLVAQLCPAVCDPMDCPTRLLCMWNSPGKNTGVGCHSLLPGIILTWELNLGLLHCRHLCQYSRGGGTGGGKTGFTECSCMCACPCRFCVQRLSTFGPQCRHGILLPMVRGCLQTSSAVSRYATLQPSEDVQCVFSDQCLVYRYLLNDTCFS